jgi:pimeloyl-ACP methyl ester carboxylesterase
MTILLALGAVAFVLAAGAVYQALGVRRDARRYAAPGDTIDVDGQRLHVHCAGSGRPPVVFESGIAASSLSWSRVAPAVAAATRACAYDRAGLGWSGPARSPRRLPLMLRELDAVVAHAAASGPAVLVGHSFGAWLVVAYAATHPSRIAGLVLLDPPSEWRDATREQARLLRGGASLARLGGLLARLGVVRASLALLAGGTPGVPRAFVRVFGPTAARTLERLVGEVRKLPPEVHPIVQAIWCQPKCFRALADHLAVLEETAAAVAGITALPDVPLVVVSSGDQPPDVVAGHRQLARLAAGGRHLVAASCGHWIQFDDPDLVIAAVRQLVPA